MEAGMMPHGKSRWIFSSRRISTFLVAIIALAWLGASNHCALAALEGVRSASHACCREDGKPAPKSQSTMQCCDTFNLTIPATVAAPVGPLHALRPAWLEVSPLPIAACTRSGSEFHATGPPRVFGFAETVLNRSLLSHAPPHFVA